MKITLTKLEKEQLLKTVEEAVIKHGSKRLNKTEINMHVSQFIYKKVQAHIARELKKRKINFHVLVNAALEDFDYAAYMKKELTLVYRMLAVERKYQALETRLTHYND